MSDLHGTLPSKKSIPKCDIICIAGDILPLAMQRDNMMSMNWLLLTFKPWAESLDCDKVVFIAGNHDFIFYDYGPAADQTSSELQFKMFGPSNKKIVYLCDDYFEYKGRIIYGTPWCPVLKKWAFYGMPEELHTIYNNIPSDIHVDILLTHCPPNIGQSGTVLQQGWNYLCEFGSKELESVLNNRTNIDWVICGHIHTGEHNITQYKNMKIVNVSIKDEDYAVKYLPFEFEI